jgi:hypothetical protein
MRYAAVRDSLDWVGREIHYEVVGNDDRQALGEAQWADWSLDGRLLVATHDGRLQIRDGSALTVRWETDLHTLTPAPTAPSPDASRW